MKIIAKGDASILISTDLLDSIIKGKSTDWERTILLQNLEKNEELAIVSLNIFGRIIAFLDNFKIYPRQSLLWDVFKTEQFSVVLPHAWNSPILEKIKTVFSIAVVIIALTEISIIGFNSPLTLLLAGTFIAATYLLTGLIFPNSPKIEQNSSPKIENELLNKIINPSLEPVT